MGAIIRGAGNSLDRSITSSLTHSVNASKDAIHKAGIEADAIDVIINVGVYRDDNIVEPAFAALIQKELGINLDLKSGRTTLSLDLSNGGIGALNAICVADSLLQSDAAHNVLVVGADAHPSMRFHKGFPYRTIGSALLLGKGNDPERGFQNFAFASDSDAEKVGRRAVLNTAAIRGRENLQFVEGPNFVPDAINLSLKRAKEFIQEQKIDSSRSFFISSELGPEFADTLAKGLGFSQEAIVPLFKSFGDCNSSVFGLAYSLLEKKVKPGTDILFVGATAGISFACAHYRL